MSIHIKLVAESPLKKDMSKIDCVQGDVLIVQRKHFYDVGHRAAVVTIRPDSYDDLAMAMIKANPKFAINAFGKALQLADLA